MVGLQPTSLRAPLILSGPVETERRNTPTLDLGYPPGISDLDIRLTQGT